MHVHGFHKRIVYYSAVREQAARQVYVLGIHEETLVEEARFLEFAASQKHEAALHVRQMPRPACIEVAQQIILALAAEPRVGDEAPHQQVGRSGQLAHQAWGV